MRQRGFVCVCVAMLFVAARCRNEVRAANDTHKYVTGFETKKKCAPNKGCAVQMGMGFRLQLEGGIETYRFFLVLHNSIRFEDRVGPLLHHIKSCSFQIETFVSSK